MHTDFLATINIMSIFDIDLECSIKFNEQSLIENLGNFFIYCDSGGLTLFKILHDHKFARI